MEIYEYQAGMLHAKTMTIDGEWAMIGSANMDNRSLALNNKISLVAYDRDLSNSRAIDVQKWRTRSL